MIQPTEIDIGRRVVYNGYKKEEGVITSFNDRVVFVRYGDQTQSAGTFRNELEFLDPPGDYSSKRFKNE
jgi:hypothetical protein